MQDKKAVAIVGLVGAAGAGKDVCAQIMGELFGTENLSTGDVVRAVTRHLFRMPADELPARVQLFPVGTFLREIDPAFTVKICIEQAKLLQINRAVITGLRSLDEADAIRAKGGIIIGMEADPKIRYERIFQRARDSEAKLSFADFLAQDEKENRGVDGKGISAIVDHADIVLQNNGASVDELRQLIQEKVGPVFG